MWLTAEHFVLLVQLVAVGLAAGVIGGMLGIGGALVMIPALLLIRGHTDGALGLQLYKLAAISASAVVVWPAAARHTRAGAVSWPLVKRMLPFAGAAILVGVWLGGYVVADQATLMRRLFGGVVLAAVVAQLVQVWALRRGVPAAVTAVPTAGGDPTPPKDGAARPTLLAATIGIPAGFLAGLLGIGGGIWAVPAQNLLFRRNLRESIANSTALIAFVAPVAAVLQAVAVAGQAPRGVFLGLLFAACLAPGALVGGWCGATLTHRLPLGWVRAVFCVILVWAGARLLLGG